MKGDKPWAGNAVTFDTHLGCRFPNRKFAALFPLESMGETGENFAGRSQISRDELDALALRSHQRWAAARAAGRLDDEIVPVDDLAVDEHPRPRTTLDELAALKPVFHAGGTVTAGNSSGINDGAAALVIVSEERARSLSVAPLGTFVASGAAGVDPQVMSMGPVPAARKALLHQAGERIG